MKSFRQGREPVARGPIVSLNDFRVRTVGRDAKKPVEVLPLDWGALDAEV